MQPSPVSLDRSSVHLRLLVLVALMASGCGSYEGYDEGGEWWGDDDDGQGADEEAPPDGEDDVCEGATTTPTTFFMSADDSNSQAAPALARHLIARGSTSPGQLALHEYLNYYDFDFPSAAPSEVGLEAQLRPLDGVEGGYSVLVAAVGAAQTVAAPEGLNLVFSIDSSCSMGGQAMNMAKESMEQMAASLNQGDIVSIVSWSSGAATILDGHAVTGPSDPELVDTIQRIREGGGTDLHNGLVTAYQVARQHHTTGRLSRVVLLSDGGANLGVVDAELIGAEADDSQDAGIYLVGVGAGDPRTYDHQLMDRVTDLGKGAYVYIDRAEEAEHQFRGPRFLANLGIAALDVRLAVELPAGIVIDAFHGEEISTNPDEVRPQHLAPNDSMQYHFELADCPGAPLDRSELFTFTLTWTDAVTREERSVELSKTLSELLSGEVRQLVKADAIIEYAEAIRDATRGSAGVQRLDEAKVVVDAAAEAFPGDADLVEIQGLLSTLRQAL